MTDGTGLKYYLNYRNMGENHIKEYDLNDGRILQI